MGVIVSIEAYVPRDVNAARTFRSAFDRVRILARKLSSYREDSEVRNVEKRAWQAPVPLSIDFSRVLAQALRLARDSGGAFDPTVGRVTHLLREHGWGHEGPASNELAEAWKRTGWENVEFDAGRRTVFLHERGVRFDLGGIAKGYIADQALEALRRAGVNTALVAIAGDIAAGAPPPGEPGWPVDLDATGARGTLERNLLLRNQAVSTSGSRERYYLADGKRCSHIVTQSTAPCADTGLAVSVVAPTGLEADGLATALLALGRDRAGEILARRPAVQVYWAEAVLLKAVTADESPDPR